VTSGLLLARAKGVPNQQILKEIGCGFRWMDELCLLLSQYETQRDRYSTFEAFLPRAANFFRTHADR
jgi:hypothetical protein